MALAKQTAKLSQVDLGYLRKHSVLPNLLNGLTNSSDATSALEIEREFAEAFREALTERLANVGFDANYQPNDEGRYLEDLIDRLFIM